MNLGKWEKLTEEDKLIFIKVMDEITPWTYAETLNHYDNIRKIISEKGVHVYRLSPEEKKSY